MKYVARSLLLSAALLLGSNGAFAEEKADSKGTVVKFDNVSSTTPADWVSEKPSSFLRLAQFKLAAVKGDKNDVSLALFKGISGSAEQNVSRWKMQFQAPEGKKIEDVAKVAEIKIGGRKATRLDIEGTYLDRPFPRSPKVTPQAGYQMVAIQFDGPENIYHIKLVGPKKSVEKHLDAFNKWLKNFK